MSKVALIIGASSGIGRATSQKLIDGDFTVCNFSREESDVEEVENFTGDVTVKGDLEKAVDAIVEKHKNIDVLIYSAGFSMSAPVEFTEDKDAQYLMSVNLFGFAEAVRCVLPVMRKRKVGRIVAVSSIGGIVPIPFESWYSASKAALNMFVRCLNLEIEPYGIKAVAVMPGGTSTSFTESRKVYPDDAVGDYSERMLTAAEYLAHVEQSGMEAETVADSVVNAATAPDYFVPEIASAGISNKFYHVMTKFLPRACVRGMVRSMYEI